MKIKFLTIIFAVLIFGFQNAFAQTESQIAKIRAEVAAINKNIAKYKRTKKDIEGISLEGTQATFYSSSGKLKKTMAKMYGESYNAVAEIYYAGDAPIFIYEKLNKYNQPIGTTKTLKVASVEETRIYYVDGQIVRMLVGKKQIKPTDEKFAETSKEYSGISEALFEAFKK